MKLHHIAILCREKTRSLDFYCRGLGFVLAESHPRERDEVLLLRGHGVTLELFIAPDRPERPSYPEAYGLRHIAFYTENAAAEAEKLRQAGYDPEPLRRDTFTGDWMTFVKDPDGLPVELHEDAEADCRKGPAD